MATDPKTPLTDIMDQARGMLATNPMLAPQMEQFWKAQEDVLKEARTFSEAWFQRRQEAAQSALDAVRDINGNGADPSMAMSAIIDWQQHSFQRLTEDMQQWVDLCTRCAGCMTSAEVEAGKQGAKKLAKRAKSNAKTKHATPV